jgi:predicted metalloprotease with PDZ domain
MRIRAATRGTKTLDDVMRLAYARFSGERGFTPEEFRATTQEVAGADLSAWFRRALDTTEELDYTEALDWLGLEFAGRSEDTEDPDDRPEEPGWIGLVTRVGNGRLLVNQVRRGTPAHEAGFNVDDEILAIGDYRVLPSQWRERISLTAPGSEISVMVSRRGAIKRLPIVVGTQPASQWDLQAVEEIAPEQERNLEAWLTGR